MTKAVSTRTWFISIFTLFLTRGFLFATWISRGPEVKELLDLNNAQMGFFTMLSAIGGLIAIVYAGRVTSHFGSKRIAIASFGVMGSSFLLMGVTIGGQSLALASLFLLILGIPIAMIDFAGNLEANALDKAAEKSRMPAVHSAYSLGMLSGSGLSSILISFDIALQIHFVFVGIIVGGVSILAGLAIPDHGHHATHESDEEKALAKKMRKAVWKERRSIYITIIGFAFILSEMVAGTWAPIAVTDAGYSDSAGAFAITMFWIAILIGRLGGGYMIDRFGRVTFVNISLYITIIGVVVFAASDYLHMPFVGLFLWGLGMSNGFPMMISAMGDENKWATPRVNMIITFVYISSLTAGPALGAVGQVIGLYAAFGIPLIFLIIACFISKESAPLQGK